MSKAQTIEPAPELRRTALLTAVVRQLEAQAVDDALDLFTALMANRLISPCPQGVGPRPAGDVTAVGAGRTDPGEGVADLVW
ncbi:hypothetical protein AB0F11_33930 [Streptomyces sp. NPDC032472]|uniref:hypothetical protein n=1 Tax=Streptomyces sp. NPDC032472 TaxID=3155018 RepID=UPI0033E39B9C